MDKITISAGRGLDVIVFPDGEGVVILDKIQDGVIIIAPEELSNLIESLQKALKLQSQ